MGRYKTWTVYAVALCSLWGLIFLPGVAAIRRYEEFYRDVRTLQKNYEQNQQILDAFASNLYLTSITIREFLLDSSPDNNREYLKKAMEHRQALLSELQHLRGNVYLAQAARVHRLAEQVDSYWNTVLPVFDWTPKERVERGTYFLRQEQRPRRESLLTISGEIARLNTRFYESQYEQLDQSHRQSRDDLIHVMQIALLIGLLVSGASILRIKRLERRALEHQEQTERAGEELRQLNTRMRHIQEDERKKIARELHDEVGQNLTTLRMGLGTLDRLRFDKDGLYLSHLAEVKELAEQCLRSIRDIAAGLRPSVLDDLGLAPAIRRDARLFARRTGIRVNVDVDDRWEELSDQHRTAIYRIVQESLTNCAKHARTQNIEISLKGEGQELLLRIEDDGVGTDPARVASGGLGLLGIRERARELGGSVSVSSEPGKGFRLEVKILWNREKHEEATSPARG